MTRVYIYIDESRLISLYKACKIALVVGIALLGASMSQVGGSHEKGMSGLLHPSLSFPWETKV